MTCRRCDREAKAAGLCARHYREERCARLLAEGKVCRHEGCGRAAEARGFCQSHYADSSEADRAPRRAPASPRSPRKRGRRSLPPDDRRPEAGGLDRTTYSRLLDSQGGVCAICGEPPGDARLAVDRCHDSGAVRGLLCHNCNLLLGHAKDDPQRLRQAIEYLGTAALL